MRGILWHVTRKLEGIFDGILMEFHMRISEDKNPIQKLMYIPQYLSSSLYSRYFTMYYYKIGGVAVLGSLLAITATSYYKIVGVAVLAFRLSLLLPRSTI